MKVHLTSAYKYKKPPAAWLNEQSIGDNILVTDDPAAADVVIFVESHPLHDPYFRKVLKDPVYRQYKKKCVLYHDADLSITPIPTISPSIELWQHDPRHKKSSHYIARIAENELLNQAVPHYENSRDFLYSFIGARTHFIRGRIFNAVHPDDSFIKETSGISAWQLEPEQRQEYEEEYLRVMGNSYFVLAPRGIGPSSYRLFEAMQFGRVPVIISDSWVSIPGVDWERCSLRIPESQIDKMPGIIRERKPDAVEMGKMARKIWELHFSPAVSLQQICNSALELVSNNYKLIHSVSDHLQFFKSSFHFMNYMRYKKNRLRNFISR